MGRIKNINHLTSSVNEIMESFYKYFIQENLSLLRGLSISGMPYRLMQA